MKAVILVLLLAGMGSAARVGSVARLSAQGLCSSARSSFVGNTSGHATSASLAIESSLFAEIRARDLFSYCENSWY